MSNKRKIKKQVQRQSSSLKDHKQIKKTLLPPLAQIMNLTPVHWNPDMIPEMLLIDAVVEQLSWKSAPGVLHKILDILDEFVAPDSTNTLLGTISSMALVPQERRDEARKALAETGLLDILLPDELRHGLALYPQCPALWLLDDWRERQSIDWEQGTRYLKGAVQRLWDSKSVYATRRRMLPLARMMKHGRIRFTADVKSMELFPRYPADLTEDEQRQVEASSRAMFNALYNIPDDSNTKDWPAYFWRHNYEISSCEQIDDGVIGEVVGYSVPKESDSKAYGFKVAYGHEKNV